MAFEIYKRGQGKYTRSATFAIGAIVGLLLARFVWVRLSLSLGTQWAWLVYGIPLVVFVGIGALMYWIVNRPGSADFMIATESEMKKVSWSSRKEVIGGTKVVIITTLALAMLLWAVDLGFSLFFDAIGVLKFGMGGGG